MEEDQDVNALTGIDSRIKALHSASTRLRLETLRQIQNDIEAGELQQVRLAERH
jgi:hypothetical protein